VTRSLRIAVVSDLHANARAVAASIDIARRSGADSIVVLGDLLTYGLDVAEVIDLVADVADRDGAHVILGNHDQLYLDLDEGRTEYFAKLPAWIRESVEHTRAQLDVGAFRRRFAWKEEVRIGDVYIAHANPFGYGDWTYLNGAAEMERARTAVAALGARVGIFGHNHRAGVHAGGSALREIATVGAAGPLDAREGVVLVNPGSVGQPRRADALSTMAVVDVDGGDVRVALEAISYDVAAQRAALSGAPLAAATREKLASFFEARPR
jgi:predicted phosphodiesterase